jgi:hypothetical protein
VSDPRLIKESILSRHHQGKGERDDDANEYKRCGGRVGFRKLPEAPRGYGTDLGVGRRCEARRRGDEAAAEGRRNRGVLRRCLLCYSFSLSFFSSGICAANWHTGKEGKGEEIALGAWTCGTL